MTLVITHSKWASPDHFEALGFEDTYPNVVIRFDYATERGWQKWRHGGWLPINLNEVPADVMARYGAAKPQSERDKGTPGLALHRSNGNYHDSPH